MRRRVYVLYNEDTLFDERKRIEAAYGLTFPIRTQKGAMSYNGEYRAGTLNSVRAEAKVVDAWLNHLPKRLRT